uniref:Uncharacterized protein n=1 Tax=Tanacetum cinerariifolium TaxID=118510 RepID=A0A6L2L9K7_TANCI|nr:hypothetical protein [Tanacetum cinerariifolium]
MMCHGVRKEIQTKDVISDPIHFDALGNMQEFVKMLVSIVTQKSMKLARILDLLDHIVLKSKICCLNCNQGNWSTPTIQSWLAQLLYRSEVENWKITSSLGCMSSPFPLVAMLKSFKRVGSIRFLFRISAEYKQSLDEVSSLAIGKGFIDGLYVDRKDEDVQAIFKATPSMDPTSSSTFMEEYNKLFDKRYPYVDKVMRAYLLDHTGLQNVIPDETEPTPCQGPHDTPMASYT